MKKALLIGINKYSDYPLKGCINDCEEMGKYLISRKNLQAENLQILANPGKKKILEAIDWLINNLKKEDNLFFYISGHGTEIGIHEAFCPVDCIIDNEIIPENLILDVEFQKIFSEIPEQVKFTWISDCCYSGDLDKDFNSQSKTKFLPSGLEKIENKYIENLLIDIYNFKPEVEKDFCYLAACQKQQTAADYNFSGKYHGAFTYYLLQTLYEIKKPEYKTIYDIMQQTKCKLKNKFEQIPELTGNPIMWNETFFS